MGTLIETLKVVGMIVGFIAIIGFVTVGIGYDDNTKPNQFDID